MMLSGVLTSIVDLTHRCREKTGVGNLPSHLKESRQVTNLPHGNPHRAERDGDLPTRSRVRHGMTMIELLVVMAVLTILLGATIPMMIPAMKQRQAREGSRIVRATLDAARNRAIENRRAAGIIFEQLPNVAGACIMMFHAETPPPFAGDFNTSGVKLLKEGGVLKATFYRDATNTTSLPATLISDGDVIQINHQGPLYRIGSVGANPVTLTLDSGVALADLPFPSTGQSDLLPYTIYRRPVKSALPPVRLPKTTVIDLGQSGLGEEGTFSLADDSSLILMFMPSGSLGPIIGTSSSGNNASYLLDLPTESVHLLIGKIDQLGVDNWKKQENANVNRWVSIGHQSGLVTSEIVSAGGSLGDARKFAHARRTAGGG